MCVCKRVGPPLKWFSFIDFLLLIKKKKLINLISLCLKLENCEVMNQTQSCGKIVLMLLSAINGYELISLNSLCLRLWDCEVMSQV